MKKLFLGAIILCSAILISCNNEEVGVVENNNLEVDNKLSARIDESTMKIEAFRQYLKENDLLENNNSVQVERSSLDTIEGIEVINLIEIDETAEFGKRLNLYRGIKTSESGKEMLPTELNEYLMILERYTNIKEDEISFELSKYDLNYNKFKFQQIIINNGEIRLDEMFDLNLNSVSTNGKPKPLPQDCLGGKDGNISWSECMNCVKSVCKSDPTCNSICDALNTAKNLIESLKLTIPKVGCNTALGIGCAGVAAVM